MLRKIHKSLSAKIIVFLGLIFVGVLSAITFMNFSAQKEILLNRGRKEASELGAIILSGIRYPMLEGEQEVVQRHFDNLSKLSEIKSISLLDHLGIIKRSTDLKMIDKIAISSLITKAFRGEESYGIESGNKSKQKVSTTQSYGIEVWNKPEETVFTEAIPIRNEKECMLCHSPKLDVLGVLNVSLDWEPVLQSINSARKLNIMVSLVGLILISLGVIILLFKIVIHPIQTVERALSRVSQGDMTVRLKPKAQDEIGLLMGMFNEMIEKIDQLIKKEEELMNLEKLRGQELSIVNKNLEEEIIERKAMQNSLDSVNKELEEEIGERKLIEDNLVESEGRIRALMDSIPHAIIGLADDKVVFANNGVERVFGWMPEEIIGWDISKLFISAEDAYSCFEVIHSAIEKTGKCEIEFMCKCKDLKQILCRLNAASIPGSGSLARMVAVFEDITEIKEAENTLKESAKKIREMYEIKSEFTSMVSHELRTPLTAIKEGIAIVLEGEAGEVNADQKEFLGMAKRNVDRLKRLIDDVLDFAKLESKKLEFRMRKADINDAVIEVIKIHTPVARDKGLYLNQRPGTDLPLIVFDMDRMLQVMNNLLSNAIKFTDTGGITVSTAYEPQTNSVSISVQDTGMGVKKEDLPKLFQKFQQLGGLNQRKTGGTGLGLAISKEIIEQHKGRVLIESEYGKGTEFKVILPVSPKCTILIIDDEEDLLELCRINLSEAGYNVLTSSSGQQGFLMATEKKPDLVISDIRLKDMNGLELVGWLKSDKSAQNIPVLLMSGFGDEISRMQKLPEDMALPWIAKPFKTEDLIKTINIILKV
ncbi:MAG: ATP-binding protein [Candidatus Omnitrophota bacterium]